MLHKMFIMGSAVSFFTIVAAAVGCGVGPSEDELTAVDSDGRAVVSCSSATPWAANVTYATGALVTYQGKTYQCIQGHTSLSTWTPDVVPALWGVVTCGTTTSTTTTGASSSSSTTTTTSASSTSGAGGAGGSTTTTTTTSTTAGAGGSTGAGGTDPGTGGKKVIGYFAEWGVYGRNYHVKNIETSGSASKLTHINYAFGNVVGGRCALGDTYADYDRFYSAAESVDGVADTWDAGALRGSFNQLRKLKAKHPGLKVMISLGGWSWSGGFSDAALPANRAAFVSSCIDLFIKDARWANLFDGIDIDWEYPGACGNTCNFRPEDTQNFTDLLAEFRKQLNAVRPGLQLSIAAPAGPPQIGKIQAGEVAKSLDFINVMTYDMHGAWETTTNFHSPLFNSPSNPAKALKFSSDEAIGLWIAGGAPASKIVLGIPFYGRGWTGAAAGNQGLWQTASGGAPGTYEVGIEDYKVLKTKGHPGFYHPETKAYWTFNGTEFWSYDNPTSIATKTAYIKSKGLGGGMFWELSGDTANGELITALAAGLQ